MSRINRRNWTAADIGYRHSGEAFDLLDNMQKVLLRVNDEEYVHLLRSLNVEEETLLVKTLQYDGVLTFGEIRQLINILNKYIDYESISNG